MEQAEFTEVLQEVYSFPPEIPIVCSWTNSFSTNEECRQVALEHEACEEKRAAYSMDERLAFYHAFVRNLRTFMRDKGYDSLPIAFRDNHLASKYLKSRYSSKAHWKVNGAVTADSVLKYELHAPRRFSSLTGSRITHHSVPLDDIVRVSSVLFNATPLQSLAFAKPSIIDSVVYSIMENIQIPGMEKGTRKAEGNIYMSVYRLPDSEQ